LKIGNLGDAPECNISAEYFKTLGNLKGRTQDVGEISSVDSHEIKHVERTSNVRRKTK
jgi:hypothetical protein